MRPAQSRSGACAMFGSPAVTVGVAVASQRVALEGQVKKFNANRYAKLSIPELEPAPTGAMPAALMSGGAQDLFSQMIMTQVENRKRRTVHSQACR